MLSFIEKAANVVDDVLLLPEGNDVMRAACIYFDLMRSVKELEVNPAFTSDEVKLLTNRLVTASNESPQPLLYAERTAAAIYLLEFGLSERMLPEFGGKTLSAEEMRHVLETCDQETFTEIVDHTAANATTDYYAPDLSYCDQAWCDEILEKVYSAARRKK